MKALEDENRSTLRSIGGVSIWFKSMMLLLALNSCDKLGEFALGGAERLCRAAIRKSLINPETAEFYDFKPGIKTAYGAAVLQNSIEELGNKYPELSRQAIVLMSLQRVMDSGNGEDVTFHSMRVKAEGRLGNKVTSEMQCASSAVGCDCQKTAD